MTEAVLLLLVCAASGLSLERHLLLCSLLQRLILVFTFAAGQLVFSIQLLSLIHRLDGTWLLLFNLLCSAPVVWLGWRKPIAHQSPWSKVLTQTFATLMAQVRNDSLAKVMLILALGILLTYSILGLFLIPMTDIYHFEMPLFWIQNHTILPFPVHNPRIITVSFVSEALALPTYLYLHTPAAVTVLALFACFLTIGVVFSLARRLGCGFGASVCAGVITLGFTLTAHLLIGSQADAVLAGMWSGASVLLLLDSHAARKAGRQCRASVWASVLCLLMACGTKNAAVLISPLYLIILILLHGRWLLTRQAWAILAGAGIAGLLWSGVAWNYVSNQLWAGDVRGNELMRATLSYDFHPRAIWTRLCRGAVLTVFDPVWIPKAADGAYTSICWSVLRSLGADHRLDEDDEFYGLDEKTTLWRKGLGLLGIAFLVPGYAAGLWRCTVQVRRRAWVKDSASFANLVLLVVGLGSFLTCHILLRFQSVGLLRLMPLFPLAGAALCAPLFTNRWAKITALVLLALSAAVFSFQGLGQVARRLDWSGPHGILDRIQLLQRSRPAVMDYQWENEPVRQFAAREWFDRTKRDAYQALLPRLRQPAVIGFAGGMDSETYHLFGDKFQNRIVSLLDSRRPESWPEPPSNLDYLVLDGNQPEMAQWAPRHRFRLVFWAGQGDATVLLAFQRMP